MNSIATEEKLGELQPAEDLLEVSGMTREIAYLLATHHILTREDLAEQAVDDLIEIEGIDAKTAGELIMAARAHWFEDEE